MNEPNDEARGDASAGAGVNVRTERGEPRHVCVWPSCHCAGLIGGYGLGRPPICIHQIPGVTVTIETE